ncbi:Uncharacterized protein pbN1_27870 [Aromatoleum bremense]|nr:Uncharacterized protein pbN1_27870 [Aromatoleum bremense]
MRLVIGGGNRPDEFGGKKSAIRFRPRAELYRQGIMDAVSGCVFFPAV